MRISVSCTTPSTSAARAKRRKLRRMRRSTRPIQSAKASTSPPPEVAKRSSISVTVGYPSARAPG